jgi:hypothetical protein
VRAEAYTKKRIDIISYKKKEEIPFNVKTKENQLKKLKLIEVTDRNIYAKGYLNILPSGGLFSIFS